MGTERGGCNDRLTEHENNRQERGRVEGGAMALIKSVKTVKGTKSNGEIQHNDEPEQDDEEVQG